MTDDLTNSGEIPAQTRGLPTLKTLRVGLPEKIKLNQISLRLTEDNFLWVKLLAYRYRLKTSECLNQIIAALRDGQPIVLQGRVPNYLKIALKKEAKRRERMAAMERKLKSRGKS